MNYKKIYADLSVKKKLILMLSAICLIFMICGTGVSFYFANRTLKNKSISYATNDLSKISGIITTKLDNAVNISQLILYNNTVYNIINSSSPSVSRIEYYENLSEINRTISDITLYNNEIQSVMLITSEGTRYGFDVDSSFIAPDSAACAKMLTAARPFRGREVWYYDENDGVFLVRTIHNRNTTDEIGAVIIKLRDSVFSDVFSAYTDERLSIMLLSGNGDVISSHCEDLSGIDYRLFFDLQSSDRGVVLRGKSHSLICYSTFPDTGWHLVITTPTKHLFKDGIMLRNIYCLIYLLIIAIIVYFSGIFTKSLLLPVNRLVDAAKAFKDKNEIVIVSVDRRDEFGYLSECFNRMALHIEEMVHQRYIEHVLKNEAQIKALQAQINPHFIFNTLDTISWIIRMNKNDTAVEMISALASLMEVNAGKISNFIPLRKELEYINNYYLILKQRFRDRLIIKYITAPETAELMIPSLIIQPLIENSASHGVGKSEKRGVILLHAFIENGSLIIDVTDNGAGIEESALNSLNKMLSMDNETFFKEVKSHKIGLENVNRRIKFFCGDSYGLHIYSKEGFYCKVRCRLPIDINRERI